MEPQETSADQLTPRGETQPHCDPRTNMHVSPAAEPPRAAAKGKAHHRHQCRLNAFGKSLLLALVLVMVVIILDVTLAVHALRNLSLSAETVNLDLRRAAPVARAEGTTIVPVHGFTRASLTEFRCQIFSTSKYLSALRFASPPRIV